MNELKFKKNGFVAGIKQVTKCFNLRQLSKIYLSTDCDEKFYNTAMKAFGGGDIQIERIFTGEQLADSCSIDVKTAIVGLLK